MKALIGIAALAAASLSGQAFAEDACDLLTSAKRMSTLAISVALDCANPEAIAEDLDELIGGFGICHGRIASDKVCSSLSGFLLDKLDEAIPEAWECEPKAGRFFVGELLKQGCAFVLSK